MKSHQISHTDLRPFKCKFDGCDTTFKTRTNLKIHQISHTDIRPFKCNFDGCTSMFKTNGDLKGHQVVHTIDGQIRKKKHESQAKKIIESWGYSIDCETNINSRRGGCVPDAQRYFSRLDFRIIESVNAILIVEVDEDQHYWYNLACEMSRMVDIQASLVSAGYTLPIYWIRYNPNGKFHIGGVQKKIRRTERETELKKQIDLVCSPDFEPENQTTLHYLYYDLKSEICGPEIMYDSEFPDVMVDFVTW